MVNKLIDTLRIVGYSWVVIVGIYIALQYVRVLLTGGLPFAQRVFSFLNIWNIFFALAALMPGLLCILASGFFLKKTRPPAAANRHDRSQEKAESGKNGPFTGDR